MRLAFGRNIKQFIFYIFHIFLNFPIENNEIVDILLFNILPVALKLLCGLLLTQGVRVIVASTDS